MATTPRGARTSWRWIVARSSSVGASHELRSGTFWGIALRKALVGGDHRLPYLAEPGPVGVHVVGDRRHPRQWLGELLPGVVQHGERHLPGAHEPEPLAGLLLDILVAP